MASNDNSTRLSPQHEEWIRKSGVKLSYLDKVRHDTFGVATMEKFRILEMTEYKRVLFLDSDIIPLCNMDYMFEESYRDDGILSNFVAISGAVAPATAAIMLFTPTQGEFGRVMDIVHRHRSRPANPTKFDPDVGWGHPIDEKDEWHSWWRSGSTWNFYAVNSDQGVLYHWLKYERLNFTHILWNKLDTWREVTHDLSYWQNKTDVFRVQGDKFIAKVKSEPSQLQGCGGKQMDRGSAASVAPFSDFYHFAGHKKPWNKPISAEDMPKEMSEARDGHSLWMYWLGEANRTLELGFPSKIVLRKGNPLGAKDAAHHLLAPEIELPVPVPALI
jgi:hypothetical protein